MSYVNLYKSRFELQALVAESATNSVMGPTGTSLSVSDEAHLDVLEGFRFISVAKAPESGMLQRSGYNGLI